MTKRTFIGIKVSLNEELQNEFEALKFKLSAERIKWVPLQNMHITLHFLGETSDTQLEQIIPFLEESTKKFSSFLMTIKDLAYFKRQSSPTAIFFKIRETEILEKLAMEIKSGLSEFGFQSGNNFKPHLTLGRIKFLKNKIRFYNLMEDLSMTEKQEINISEIILYESILKPEGPVYKPLKSFTLS